MKLILVSMLGILLSTEGFAKPYPKLKQFVDENVSQISQGINSAAAMHTMDFGGGYEFKRVYLRIRARAGFDIEAAKLELVPEIELVFQKENVL